MPIGDLFQNKSKSNFSPSSSVGLSGMFNPSPTEDNDLIRAQRQTENTKQRLIAAGQGDKIQEKKSDFSIWNILRQLSRPGYAANALIREFTNPDEGLTPGEFDPLKAFVRGFKLEETPEGSDIIGDLGVENKIAKGVLGLALDIFNPLDVLNWVTFGVGKAAVKGGVKGAAALSTAFGDDVAEAIVKLLGKNADDIAGKTIGALTKEVMKAGKTVGANSDELAKLMVQGLEKTGKTLGAKLPYEATKRLTVALETPFGRKALSNAIELPGTELITKPIGKAADTFMSTKLGNSLGKMFSTKYVPKEVSDSVVLKKIQQAGSKLVDDIPSTVVEDIPDLIDNTIEIGEEANKAIKQAFEYVPEEGSKIYQEFKEGITRIFETAPRKQDDFLKQVNKLFEGTTADDRAIILQGILGKTEVPEHLQPMVDGFKAWRDSVIKTYHDLGIPIHELENYVPFIPTRALKEHERMGLRALFGEATQKLETDDDILEFMRNIDPNLKKRTLNQVDPTEINRVLDKPWLSEDPAHMMMVRGTRAIRAEEVTEFMDNFLETYGLTISDIASLRETPKGYAYFENIVDNTGIRRLKQVTKLTESNTRNVVAIPEEFAKVFNDYMELFFNTDSKNAALRVFDQATGIWKKWAYLYNPGHIPRDITGNLWQGYLMGLRNPAYYTKSSEALKQIPEIMEQLTPLLGDVKSSDIDGILKVYKQAIKDGKIKPLTITVGKKSLDAFEAYQKAMKYGVLETAASMAETPATIRDALNITQGNKVTRAVGKYEQILRKWTEDSNNWTRFAGFLHELGEGKTFSGAAANVKKFYFDYFDLTPFERKVMKRIMPFYTWTRKNIPMEIEALLRRPKDFARTQDVINAIQGGDIEPDELPDWAKDVGLIRLGDTGKFINPNLPYQDIGRAPFNLDNLANMLASLNPLIRGPVELATNTELYSGKPIEKYTNEEQDIPIIGALANLLGIEGLPQVDKRGLGYVANQLPMLRNIDTMLNPDNPRQGARIASTLGLPSYFDEEQLKASEIYEENRRLLELLRLLRDRGIEIPTTQELNQINPILKLLGINLNDIDPEKIKEDLRDIGLSSIFRQ